MMQNKRVKHIWGDFENFHEHTETVALVDGAIFYTKIIIS